MEFVLTRILPRADTPANPPIQILTAFEHGEPYV